MKKKRDRKGLMKALDKLWSEAVRKEWKGLCAVCGGAGTQSHHFFSRRHHTTRWEPDNGVYLCFADHILKCHREGYTEDVRDALIKRIGIPRFVFLKELSREVSKFKVADLEEIQENLEKGA